MYRTLMLVWTGVSTDTRVLREATALVAAGHEVHLIGRDDIIPFDTAVREPERLREQQGGGNR